MSAAAAWADNHATFIVEPSLPPTSAVWDIAFPAAHILVRPYIPDPLVRVGEHILWIPQRHAKHPVIWGWVLAIRERDLERDPALDPGAMVVFKRFANEPMGNDTPAKPRYLGHTFPIHILSIDAIECAFTPPLIELEK